MIKLAKRCPYCAHKVDQTTGKCVNQNCIAYGTEVVKTDKPASSEAVNK